jgi:hypothetical protein
MREPNQGAQRADGGGRRPAPDQVGFPHGEYRGYQWGCRCGECREAQRAYMKGYRERRKAREG